MFLASLALDHSAPFFEGPHFWEGAAAAAVVGGFFFQWVWPIVHKGWIRRRNFMVLIEGRKEIPGVAPAIPALPDILGEFRSDIKIQGTAIADIREMIALALRISANTNLKVTANGGNTDSGPDVMQRVAKKLGVWEHDRAPPISVANVIDLGDVLAAIHPEVATTDVSIPPHHHDGLQGGEVTT